MAKISFLSTLSLNDKHLTVREKKIVNFMFNYQGKTVELTLNSISANCGVGNSVIYNLISKLGFSGLKEMLFQIDEEKTNMKINEEFNQPSSGKELIAKAYIALLEKNFDLVDFASLNDIAHSISSKKRVFMIGYGESWLIARAFWEKLTRFGINCSLIDCEEGKMYVNAIDLNVDDLLIAFSLSGETRAIVNTCQLVKKNSPDTKVVIFTAKSNSSLAQYADKSVLMISSNSIEANENIISPVIGGFYLVDVICYQLIKLDEKYLKHRQQTSELITKMIKNFKK